MQSKYISEELFHFVGHAEPANDEENFRTLCKVLNSECVSHPPHSDGWGVVEHTVTWDWSLEDEKLVVPSVTCFADIPYDSLSIHIEKYGKFGLGLPISLLATCGARPVTYFPIGHEAHNVLSGRWLLRDVEAVLKGFHEQIVDNYPKEPNLARTLGEKPQSIEHAVNALESIFLKDFLAFLKPYNWSLSSQHPENYYFEREWRKYGNMKFSQDQVTRLVVANGYKERLVEELPQYEQCLIEEC